MKNRSPIRIIIKALPVVLLACTAGSVHAGKSDTGCLAMSKPVTVEGAEILCREAGPKG